MAIFNTPSVLPLRGNDWRDTGAYRAGRSDFDDILNNELNQLISADMLRQYVLLSASGDMAQRTSMLRTAGLSGQGRASDASAYIKSMLASRLADKLDGKELRVRASMPVSETGGNGVGEQVLALAMSRLGDPYSMSLAGQGAYTDCSYLTQWCYRQVGIQLPRTAAEQGRYCVDNGFAITKEELQPGDLIFFSHNQNGRYRNITHVAIYAGDGMVVDASSSRGEVVYRALYSGQVLYGRPRAV